MKRLSFLLGVAIAALLWIGMGALVGVVWIKASDPFLLTASVALIGLWVVVPVWMVTVLLGDKAR